MDNLNFILENKKIGIEKSESSLSIIFYFDTTDNEPISIPLIKKSNIEFNAINKKENSKEEILKYKNEIKSLKDENKKLMKIIDD